MESSNNCGIFQEEIRGLLFDGSNLQKEDACLFDYISKLDNPKDVLDHSKKFKDEGNSSFKEGDLDGALEKYGLSLVFLSCVILKEVADRTSFSQLASSVILNMAVSLLKTEEFRQVGHLCSIVLNHNPENIKALFRRANAAIGLSNFELACWDLRLAQEIDSSNQEVVRKLREVEQILNSINQGQRREKRKECGPMGPIHDAMGKEGVSKNIMVNNFDFCKNMNVEESDGKTITNQQERGGFRQNERGNIICKSSDICKNMDVEENDGRINGSNLDHAMGMSETKDVSMSERTIYNEAKGNKIGCNPNEEKSKHYFRNKRKPESALVISKRDYNLLARGRTIQHFNSKSGIAMSIRIIDYQHETPNKSSEKHTQDIAHFLPNPQDELTHHKGILNSVGHDTPVQSEGSALTEPRLHEEVKTNQKPEVTPLPDNCPPFASHCDKSPTCFQIFATSNRGFPFLSITTGNRSRTRRTQNQAPVKGAMKNRRFRHRKPTYLSSNHGFPCRSKIDSRFNQSDYLPPNNQFLSSYRSGTKRKASSIQSRDLPQQPRKLLSFMNAICNSYSRCVCNLTFKNTNVKMAKTSAPG